MSELIKRLMILDCCGCRFSKVVELLSTQKVEANKEIIFDVLLGESRVIDVVQIFQAGLGTNVYELDAVFLKSNDDDLWEIITESIGEDGGWFENEDACSTVLKASEILSELNRRKMPC